MDRRTAMESVLSLAAKGGIGSASVMAYLNDIQPASADSTTDNVDSPSGMTQSSFTAYNIIPDQSASLDPRLVSLEVSRPRVITMFKMLLLVP